MNRNNRNNTNEQSFKNTPSIALDLETLTATYDNLLTEYNQLQSDYIDYLNQEAKNPCANFTANSKNISQACYDYIWKRSGCNTQAPRASSNWAQNQTLNGLINDSFLWATLTGQTHRRGCYGNSTNFTKATSPNFNINGPELTTVQGRTFWGTGQATSTSTSNARTLDECKALCSSNTRCTGATFNATSHGRPICWLRTGEANISNGLRQDVAIVSQKMMYLNRMKTLNTQLQDINNKISKLISTRGDKIYKNQIKMRKEKNSVLEQNQIQLQNQHKKIISEINEYESLDNEQNEESLKVKQNYAIYSIMVIIAIIAVILVVKMSSSGATNTTTTMPTFQRGGELSNKTYYGLFFVILIAILIKPMYN